MGPVAVVYPDKLSREIHNYPYGLKMQGLGQFNYSKPAAHSYLNKKREKYQSGSIVGEYTNNVKQKIRNLLPVWIWKIKTTTFISKNKNVAICHIDGVFILCRKCSCPGIQG